MKRTSKVALSGIITALCVVLMFFTGVFPGATYALPAIAGALLVICVCEMGKGWALLVYIASSFLSLFIAADKEAAMLYVFFFGHYSIIKALAEQIRSKFIEYSIKFAVFNAGVIISYFIVINFFGLPEEAFELFGLNLPLIFLAAGNATFILYDITLTKFILLYYKRFHKQLKKIMRH